MVRTFGLFAGFELESKHSLRRLAIALDYWLAGARDNQSEELRKLTQLQERTIGMLAHGMAISPLLRRLVAPLLKAPRGGKGDKLLVAGRELIDYAVPGVEQPGIAAYQDALSAWQNRWPLQPRDNALHNYAALTRNTMAAIADEEDRRDTLDVTIIEDEVSVTFLFHNGYAC
jgi:hypothetical protein